MSPFHLLFVLPWLCIAVLASDPLPSCERNCSGIEIPYPFGLEPACALSGFNLTCNTTEGKLYSGNVELLNISLLEGWVRMRMDISSYCYNDTSQLDEHDWSLDLRDTPYRLSNVGNMFTVIGCRTLAYVDNLDTAGNLTTTGCVATCWQGNYSSLNDGDCFGIGCCQMNIPKGLQYYQISFDPRFNTTEIYNFSRCSYAALIESSNFTFSKNYSTSSAFNDYYGGQAPLRVDWAIGNETCEVARDKVNYSCMSTHSDCFNSLNGPGYICNCSKGFYGNPYLKSDDPDSCQVFLEGENCRVKLNN
uniref:Wall-associated receptor kinase galacturonan-binding domain-containing protein n=1 Tax=Oryza meridionalis TaxID=40149 RepID=A0A0E0DD38_9ORYZ